MRNTARAQIAPAFAVVNKDKHSISLKINDQESKIHIEQYKMARVDSKVLACIQQEDSSLSNYQ